MATVVAELELDQPRVVTLSMLADFVARSDRAASPDEPGLRRLAYELQRRGWLGSLRTRNAWEFLPGSRAGAYGSGDRFIELRANLALRQGWPAALAMESAAGMLGLAQRLPEQEVVALPRGVPLPKGLSDWRRVEVQLPGEGISIVDKLPCWTLEGLIAGIAMRPSGYRDLAGLAQWLPEVGTRIQLDALTACLTEGADSAWQRAAYLTRLAGAPGVTNCLLHVKPPRGTLWYGADRGPGVFDSATQVSDAELARYMSGGTGA